MQYSAKVMQVQLDYTIFEKKQNSYNRWTKI